MMENDINQDDEDASEGRGQYYQYQKDTLQVAIEKIKNNEMSYGEASRCYGVPKTTLYNKMQNTHNSRRGAKTTLTKAQEDELAEWILKHQEYGDPRTKLDIIKAACEIAELDADSSKHFKNGLPTAGWVEKFLERYPHIVFRKPESISKAAAVNTKEDFSKLWRNIYAFLEKTNQLDLLHKPEHWWNADETSFPKDPIPRKVLARKGSKNDHRRERGPPKANTTFTYAFSAAGDYIEPLITLKDSASNIADIAFACGSVGANFGISQTDSGWAKEDSFYHYVATHLHTQWEHKGSPKPRILVIDGYRAHLSVRLLRWGKLNDCIIIVLYPNGTPYLQMCDTTMYKPMKEKYIELYQQWRLKNPIGNSDDVVLVKLIKLVNDAVIRKESIINGWRATGLQPFDFNNLKCDDLLCKSPDYVYDFKGHHIRLKTDAADTTADEMSITSFTDHLLAMDFDRSNYYETFKPIVSDDVASSSSGRKTNTNQPINDRSVMDRGECNTTFSEYGDNHSTVHDVPIMRIADMERSNIAFEDTLYIGQNEVVDSVDSKYFTQNIERPNYEPSGVSNIVVNFTDLSCRGHLFRSNVNTGFDVSDFGITDHASSQNTPSQSTSLSKLTQKIRRNVKELGLLCAATDKKKLLNVLIINQQLDAIDPPDMPTEGAVNSSNGTPTIKTILVPPTMPQTVKAKTHRNIKVGYGVATATKVLEHLAEREIFERQLEEENEIEKKAREKKIEDIERQLQETRNVLSTLRSENASNVKEAAQQKKSKKRKSNGSNDISLDETIHQNKIKIQSKNEELKNLREQLKTLKSNHISANKAAAAKRKSDIQLKKARGNVVIPPPASSD